VLGQQMEFLRTIILPPQPVNGDHAVLGFVVALLAVRIDLAVALRME